MRKKVFISYDHSEDVHYKRLLAAWDANTNFQFEFDDRSPGVAIDSSDAGVIKATLTAKLKQAEYLLVIVGSKTYSSQWVAWEIGRAKASDVRLRLAAVKIDRTYATPSGLIGVGTSWAYRFAQEAIIAALEGATDAY